MIGERGNKLRRQKYRARFSVFRGPDVGERLGEPQFVTGEPQNLAQPASGIAKKLEEDRNGFIIVNFSKKFSNASNLLQKKLK